MTYFCEKQLASNANKIALVDEHTQRSWQQLNQRSNALVNALRNADVAAQDRIAIFAGNRCEYFELMLAASHSGVVYVPVNWHFSAEELAYVIDNSDAKLLFVDAAFADIAAAAIARNETPGLQRTILIGNNTNAKDLDFDAYEDFLGSGATSEPIDQCLGGPMFYTSGTTGRPKGVKSSTFAAGGPLAMMEMIGSGLTNMLAIPSDGRTFLCGPVYHSAQWAFSYLPLIAGSSVIMQHKFDPADCLQLIDKHKITNVHLVPTQFHRLLRLPQTSKTSFVGNSLKVVWHGAAPCPPKVKGDMLDWWGDVICEYYGSTEGSIVTTANATDWRERPGTVGKPAPIVEISIRDDQGAELASHQTGQIYVKSVMGSDFEYHNEPEKTADVHLEPGLYTFGDIGYLDDDGYLYLSDRKIDMIISGGVNIYPAEIEAVLVSHPRVSDAAVFGIPNEEFGEEVKAAVCLTDGVDPNNSLTQELMQHCRDHLAGYKTPRSIDYETEFPRSETGKLYKRLLRDKYWQDADRSI